MKRHIRRGGASAIALALAFAFPLLFASPGHAQVPYAGAAIKAAATGTVVHAGALQSDDTRVLDGEVGFSGAAFDAGGLGNALANEMQRVYAPANGAKLASGRASALEVGLGITPKDDNQVILAGRADANS